MKLVHDASADDSGSDLVDVNALIDAGATLYASGGLPAGDSTGFRNLDGFYSVMPSQVTVVTGVPGSGKSEFVDAVAVNLAEASERDATREPWEFCVYSPENYPTETHLIKLVEKRARKPFSHDWPGEPRMTLREYREAAAWVGDRFFWLAPELATPEILVRRAGAYRQGERRLGIILDPWNTLDHERGGLSETDYVSRTLTDVIRLARRMNAHVWLVAHPKQLPRNRDGTRPIPSPYDISGSAHWYNKPDNILVIHRDQSDHASDSVDIHVMKVRFKHCGRAGHVASLRYARATGRYFDAPPPIIDKTTGKPERYAEPKA